jgi:hypothetical protein
MESVDGSIDEIIRKPFAVDESPIKTLHSTMGRKQPQISHEKRFNIEDSIHQTRKKTFN